MRKLFSQFELNIEKLFRYQCSTITNSLQNKKHVLEKNNMNKFTKSNKYRDN